MRWVVAILCLLMASCTARRPVPTVEPHVIFNDGGGQIASALADRRRLERWGGRVEIRGYCASSCAIFTTLPNACLGDHAQIGFHNANIPGAWRALAPFFRGEVRERFEGTWRKSSEMTLIPARQYVQLDPQARLCSEVAGQ